MLHLVLAVLYPPLGVLFMRNRRQVIISVLLTCLLYVPGLIHALLIITKAANEKDNK